ncbi:MAG: divergent PAP2 family protein [Trueperaceae bacterium]
MTVLENTPLWAALSATALAQVVKILLVAITERRWAFERALETGGMPSSHSAAVAALATSMGMIHGFHSPYFAMSAVFGFIVMYDATGIRRASGMQAELINRLVKELSHLFSDGFQANSLKTLLGHTYPQVLVGALLGVMVGLLVTI